MEGVRGRNLPNFLIVGAPKCGTTSLYYYLKQHPEIFLPEIKEPKFMMAQFLKFPLKGKDDAVMERMMVKDFRDYKFLFSGVKGEKAVGEASVGYLYHYQGCIPQIKKYLGDPKIIIVLRNPIERIFSHYNFFIREGKEKKSLLEAIEAEPERIKQNYYYGWHYFSVGEYFEQVKAYLNNFFYVKILLHEDLLSNPKKIAREIFSFLEVDENFIPDVSYHYNVSGVPKNSIRSRLIINSLTRVRRLYLYILRFQNTRPKDVKNNMSAGNKREKIVQFTETIKNNNLVRPEMKPETRAYLKGVYREDILKLQDLIGRDLSHWLE